ncbi:MAG: cell division protein FtsL [Firmicutes bacterium]|nr:cell division protein FtsL [Bacillota bacterium]
MAESSNKPRIRFRVRRGSRLVRAVLIAAVSLSVVAIVVLSISLRAALREQADLRQQAADLEEENSRLEEKIDALGSVDGVAQIAQDELGLVDPDTIIIETSGD